LSIYLLDRRGNGIDSEEKCPLFADKILIFLGYSGFFIQDVVNIHSIKFHLYKLIYDLTEDYRTKVEELTSLFFNLHINYTISKIIGSSGTDCE
jgi:hypothetical protein